MKIILVTEYYWPHVGGVEVLFQSLAEGYVKAGHEVHVVTSRLAKAQASEIKNGVHIHRVPVIKLIDRYVFTLTAIPTVVNLARTADIIHATIFNAVIPSWIAAWWHKKKSVLTVHEVFGKRWTELFNLPYVVARLNQLSEKCLLKFSFDRYVTVSDWARLSLLPYQKSEKIVRIYNGIDKIFAPKTAQQIHSMRKKLHINDEFIYLFYGRAGVAKGVEYLIRAVPEISKHIPRSKLLLILSRKPKSGYNKVKKLINQLGIADTVLRCNSVPFSQLPDYISLSDCVVIPSLSEGFGFSAAESCAVGKPVVVTQVASLPEVVSGQVVFIEPKDPAAIAKGVIQAYQGQTLTIPPRQFSWEKTINQHLELYKSLLKI